MPQESVSEVEYWYDVEDHIDLDWFNRYINQIDSFANNPEKVRIEVWMCPTASTRRRIFYTSAEAKVFIASEWPNIEESVIIQYAGKVRQSLLNHQHHYLRIRIDETPELPTSQAVAVLQKSFKLVTSKPHP